MKEEKNTECGFCHCGSEKQGCGELHQTEIKKKVIAAHAKCMVWIIYFPLTASVNPCYQLHC